MDNKITKRRFSDFMAYEWLMIIIVSVIAIIVFELVYTVSAVRLTVGQEFKFYLDTSVSSDTTAIYDLIQKDQTFSFDVLKVNSEKLDSQYNVLSTRLSIQEGDVLFTDCKEPEQDAKDKTIQLKSMVDKHGGYSYNQMLKDAKSYLLDNFMVDGFEEKDLTLEKFDYGNLDVQKIEKVFRQRMKKDNRFRKEGQIKEGVDAEILRIRTLYEDVIKFDYLLSLEQSNPELFYKYTKYEQMLEGVEKQEEVDLYQKLVDREVADGRGDNVYALRLGALTAFATDQDKSNPSKYFTVNDEDDAKNVVLMVFNFRGYQPHLQYECISFINAFVEDCSNIYDNVISVISAKS